MAALETRTSDAVASVPPPSVLTPPGRATRYRTMEFGESLRRQCAFFATVSGLAITCTAVRQWLPWPVASQLTLVAEELLTRAFIAFEGSPGGTIQVSFGTTPTALELTVEHSRPPTRASDSQLGRSARLIWRAVDRLGGRFESLTMIGGVRMIITVPWPSQF